MALRSLEDSTGQPSITVDDDGLRTLSWPQGRPAVVELDPGLLEALVEDLNSGRRAINVLVNVAQALRGLVASPPDNATTGVPTP